MNFNTVQQNTYSMSSLENTKQDMSQTNMGMAFPSTPNIQSARGSIQNQPMASARSI